MSSSKQGLLDQWLDSACQSVQEVMANLGTQVTLGQTAPAISPGQAGAYVTVESEHHSYLIALVSTEYFQKKLVSEVLGWTENSTPNVLRDAMGEITNMIAGTTKKRMSALMDMDLTMGLPLYVRGEVVGASATRTRKATRTVTLLGQECVVIVIQRQASGEAVRRRLAERKLRDSEERQRAILRAVPDAVITCSHLGEIRTFNSAAERAFDRSSEDTIGHSASTLIDIADQLDQLVGGEHRGIAQKRDGSSFPVEISVSQFKFRETRNFVVIARDVTQREEARTKLEDANKRMVELSHAAGKAEVASDVLHNVGNVLNSVNTTTNVLVDRERKSNVRQLEKIVLLIETQKDQLPHFFENDSRGKKVLPFLELVVKDLSSARSKNLDDLEEMQRHVDHIKRVVTTQQLLASAAGVTEEFRIHELASSALTHVQVLIESSGIAIEENFDFRGTVVSDKNKVLQIVINLIKNACEALGELCPDHPRLTLRTLREDETLVFDVEDNGGGISQETMASMFSHGFTTKKGGHGFGLHGCALYAKQLGGSLRVESDGPGQGSKFTLRLPIAIAKDPITTASSPRHSSPTVDKF